MNKHEKKFQIRPVESIKKEIRSLIKQLKNFEIDCFSVPKEYQNEKKIVDVERKLGIRTVGKRGYDIIKNVFFVEEEFKNDVHTEKKTTYFGDFESYFSFVDGEIYVDACYYQFDVSKIKRKIDYDRLYKHKFFVEHTIDHYTLLPTAEEIFLYNKSEQIKNQCKQWITLFNKCITIDEFYDVEQKYRKSKLCTELAEGSVRYTIQRLLRWQYIFSALNDKKRFEILMKYMSRYTCNTSLVREICTVFNPDDVMAAYNFTGGSKQNINKQKKRLQDIVDAVKYGFIDKSVFAFFDEGIHYYCEKCTYTLPDEQLCRSEGMRSFATYRYFETFEDFIKFRKGDLTNCDLTKSSKLDFDFTKCIMDDTTKLPLGNMEKLRYVIKKKYTNGKFNVLQEWYNSNGICVKRNNHNFDYFFDFVAFMKGDLSAADLLFCDGLQNLNDTSGINFINAIVTSETCEKLGIPYKLYKVDNRRLESFDLVEENEKSTELILQSSRELAESDEMQDYDPAQEKIYYVSDIHLLHKLKDFSPKSTADVLYVINSIVVNIVKESEGIILIGGDVASDFFIFKIFVEILRRELDSCRKNPLIIFILGNHELWEFPHNSLDEIIMKYDDLLMGYGMYLLHNNVLYKDSKDNVHRVTTEELLSLDNKTLRKKTRTSRIVFFGGLGFSGYNENFNANSGIYRDTIDRITEIKESKQFELLYNKVCSVFSDKNVVVFTHMPIDCWNKMADYHQKFVYVSGHTHRNYFYDDGDIRLYADNQVGYGNNNTHMKWFDIANTYDYFADYQDGIYKISSYEYLEFYRGKNLMVNFNRAENILYMLKKKGYYCFFHMSKGGSFTILNGGALKKVKKKDINYYYENMDSVIALIKKPLDTYTAVQETISMEIKRIGGSGNIHGCIIDIDWYNHVYVNPFNMKVTGYCAEDIMNKSVYPTVLALLEKKCPALYARYTKLLKENSKAISILKKSGNDALDLSSERYLETDIYKVSREIKKMQKLSSNILTTWYDIDNTDKRIESNQN